MASFVLGSKNGVEGNQIQHNILDILKKRSGSKIITSFNESAQGTRFEENLPFNVKNIETEDKEYLKKLINVAQDIFIICEKEGL